MRALSSAGRSLSFSLSFAVLFTAFTLSLSAEGSDLNVLMEPSAGMMDEARGLVQEFMTPGPAEMEAAQKIRAATVGVAEIPLLAATGTGKTQPTEDTYQYFKDLLCSTSVTVEYLISFSMQDKVIERLLMNASEMNGRCGRGTVSVGIRGFVNGSMKDTLMRIAKLINNSPLGKTDVPLVLAPDVFRKYGVKEVPFIIVKGKGQEKRLKGDMGMEYALSHGRDGERAGRTYPVMEEDFYETVKAASGRLATQMKQTRRPDRYDLTRNADRFRKADTDRVFYIDPAYIVEEDIKDPAGRIIVKKGVRVDPSDYGRLGRYIFIDGRDEKQVAFAVGQKASKIIIVAGDPFELTRKHDLRFFTAEDMLVYGLRLEKMPSIVEQEGRYIRVTEKKL